MQSTPTSRWKRWRIPGSMIALTLLAAVAHFQTQRAGEVHHLRTVYPKLIMGTSCRIGATSTKTNDPRISRGLAAAEQALRRTEALMSTYVASSELSQFNHGAANHDHALSPSTLHVLRVARQLHQQSGGAFDVTCRPLVELWRQAEKTGVAPDATTLERTRQLSNWNSIQLGSMSATKAMPSTRVDLGGIAKGHGIDRALEALKQTGVSGGMVDVGGDLRVFGRPPKGDHWHVDVRSPFSQRLVVMATLALKDGAVATSGGYARFFTIAGKKYSHIIDPRTGRPATRASSVTVIAKTALLADAWATALSVLGPEGLKKLPADVHAMVVTGDRLSARALVSRGLSAFLLKGPPFALEHVGEQ